MIEAVVPEKTGASKQCKHGFWKLYISDEGLAYFF